MINHESLSSFQREFFWRRIIRGFCAKRLLTVVCPIDRIYPLGTSNLIYSHLRVNSLTLYHHLPLSFIFKIFAHFREYRCISLDDDPTLPVHTVRMYVIGLGLTCFSAVLSQIFYFRPQTVFVSGQSLPSIRLDPLVKF
jgi:hypothetical protein